MGLLARTGAVFMASPARGGFAAKAASSELVSRQLGGRREGPAGADVVDDHDAELLVGLHALEADVAHAGALALLLALGRDLADLLVGEERLPDLVVEA